MSHFALAVAIPAGQTVEKDLARILQPFHEYECTGIKDQYVVFVDKEDEYIAEYNKQVERWKSPSNEPEIVDKYDSRFQRLATFEELEIIGPLGGSGSCYRKDGTRISYTTEYNPKRTLVYADPKEFGYTSVMASGEEAHGPFDEWVEDWDGAEKNIHTGRYGRWTNPNKKWDWWQIGGRYSDRLISRAGEVGDACRVGDLDFPAMRAYRIKKYEEWIEADLQSIMKQHKLSHDEAYAAADAYSLNSDSSKYDCHMMVSTWGTIKPGKTIKQTLEEVKDLSFFAFLDKNGTWNEQGSMGWFAVVHDRKEEDVWEAAQRNFLKSLNPDDTLVIVDCHI